MHSAHTDQASHAAERRLIPPLPLPCSLAPSVTTPLYSTTVSRALRQTLRSRRSRTKFRESPKGEVRRIPIPRTPVNNANSSDRISQYPKGRTHRAGEWQKEEALPAHSQDALLGVSSPKAGEFLLKERVVLHTLLLAFQPLHVAFNPRVVALGHKARESL